MADRYKTSHRMPMVAIWLLLVAAPPVMGQESTATLTVPPEQQILRMEVTSPEEVRVGGSIEYQVTITNLSDDMVVHNIVIEHVKQDMPQQNGTEREEGQQPRQAQAREQGQPGQSDPERQTRRDQADQQRADQVRQQDRPQPPQQERPEDEQARQPQAQPQQPQAQQPQAQQPQPQAQQPQAQQPQAQQPQAQQQEAQQQEAQQQEAQQQEAQQQEAQQQAAQQQEAQQQQAQQQQAQQQQTQQQETQQQETQQRERQQQERQQTGHAAQEQQRQHQQQNEQLHIDVLQPGESKQLTVQVAADQQGEMRHCFAVTSYTPALCVVTRITMADLELVKQAPETANICEDFEFAYFVKNTGTTDLENITISDELPEGVHLVSGESSLEFEVDGLEVDEVRKFTADVRATRPGTIASRATATFADDQQVRSRETSTEVVAPEVAVSIEGPRQVYLDDPMAFSIRVTNQGQAVAPHTRLQLEFPQQVRVSRVGEPYLSDQAARGQDGRTAGQQEPTRATPQAGQQQEPQQQEPQQQEPQQQEPQQQEPQQQEPQQQERQQQEPQQQERQQQADEQTDQAAQRQQRQDGQQQDGQQDPAQRLQGLDNDQEYWNLGDLEPGQTVVVEVRLQADEAVEIPLKATAGFICALGGDRDDARVQTTALTDVRVIAMAGLLVTVIDTEDPIPVGGETSYVIRVRNQGDAPATQVQISINLPDGLEFKNGEGPTESEGEGQTITFAPVETLDAGERLEYRIHATASQPGDLRIQVDLTSDDLSEPVISQESTRVYEN